MVEDDGEEDAIVGESLPTKDSEDIRLADERSLISCPPKGMARSSINRPIRRGGCLRRQNNILEILVHQPNREIE